MYTNTLTVHKSKISVPFGELQSIIDWCDNNCTDRWQYMEDPGVTVYNSWIFIFESERDYVAFTLWRK